MARIRKGDLVEVISGNDRGKRGRVLRVIPEKDRIVIEGVNLRWRHMRKSQQTPQGGRMRREMPVHVSNVMIYDDAAGVATRIGFLVTKGKKVRIGRKTGAEIGAVAEKKPAATKKKKAKRKKAAKKTQAGETKE